MVDHGVKSEKGRYRFGSYSFCGPMSGFIQQHLTVKNDMPVISKLQLAADALEDAKRRLNRAKDDVDDDYEIRQALKILDDATDFIRNAITELKL